MATLGLIAQPTYSHSVKTLTLKCKHSQLDPHHKTQNTLRCLLHPTTPSSMLGFMKKTILFSLLLLPALSTAAIYQWTDEGGRIVYGDNPPTGVDATLVDVKPAQTFSLPASQSSSAQETAAEEDTEAAADEPVEYQTVSIVSPADDEPIRSNSGFLTVKASSSPALAADQGDQFELMMDGRSILVTTSATMSVQNVDRGTHQLQVRIIDKDGKPKKASDTISFHLLRVAVGGGG